MVRDAAEVRVVLDPRAGFGERPLESVSHRGGIWTARSGPLYLRWSAGPGVRRRTDGSFTLGLRLDPAAHHDLVLEISDRPLAEQAVAPGPAWDATEAAWGREVPPLDGAVAPDARHAYTVIRGLTTAGGGMVAAATMSLPEAPPPAATTTTGTRGSGTSATPDRRWQPPGRMASLTTPSRSSPNGCRGRPVPQAGVSGRRRRSTRRAGPGPSGRLSGRFRQGRQLGQPAVSAGCLRRDLVLFAAAGRHDHLSSEHWRAVEASVGAIEARWQQPDAGLWELDNQRWAHSRLTCVAGLRAIGGHATTGQAARWTLLADAILADAGRDCTHPAGRWQRAPGDARVDAALLVPAIRGAVHPGDPRSVATLNTVIAELTRDGYTYRFRHDERHLGEAEGAFLLCGFWLALACQRMGWDPDAIASFERSRAACGAAGLLTEEYDVAERQLRGNAPQAFVHALLLECALSLSALWLPTARAMSPQPPPSIFDGNKLGGGGEGGGTGIVGCRGQRARGDGVGRRRSTPGGAGRGGGGEGAGGGGRGGRGREGGRPVRRYSVEAEPTGDGPRAGISGIFGVALNSEGRGQQPRSCLFVAFSSPAGMSCPPIHPKDSMPADRSSHQPPGSEGPDQRPSSTPPFARTAINYSGRWRGGGHRYG